MPQSVRDSSPCHPDKKATGAPSGNHRGQDRESPPTFSVPIQRASFETSVRKTVAFQPPSRQKIVLTIVAASPYELKDEIKLATDDANLLALLTNRNDKALQKSLFELLANRNDKGHDPDVPKTFLLRDWRESILTLAEAEERKSATVSIWKRVLKKHNRGGYYLYNSASIRGALPVGDWRIELRPDGKLSESYRKLRGKNEPDWDFLPNDGDSHNEHLCDNTVMLYLQPDKITVRRKKGDTFGDHETLWPQTDAPRSETVWEEIPDTIQTFIQELTAAEDSRNT